MLRRDGEPGTVTGQQEKPADPEKYGLQQGPPSDRIAVEGAAVEGAPRLSAAVEGAAVQGVPRLSAARDSAASDSAASDSAASDSAASDNAAPSGWLTRLSADDRAALGIWILAHLALLILAWAAAWAFRSTDAHAPLTGGFEQWDARLLRNIAQYGYFGHNSIKNNAAFFPGYPVALAAMHLIVRNWLLAELLVPAVAGCFALVSLSRLAGGRRAVLYLVTAPAAIFLMVGYAETLFLAFAIPAWHAASRGRWGRAALLAGLAGLIRPDALFLIPALALMALLQRGRPARARVADATIACLGLIGPAAYELYLKAATGSWTAWSTALRAGWDLRLTSPQQALKTTWWAAFRHPFSAGTSFEFQLELATMVALVLVTLAFAAWRRWPEAVYCGLAVVALGTSTWYETLPRTMLVLFPIWIALAQLDRRWPWTRYVYLGVSAPIAVVLGMLFLSGQWAG